MTRFRDNFFQIIYLILLVIGFGFMAFYTLDQAHAVDRKVVLKKGMIVTCPANHERAYKVVSSIREGDPILAEQYKDLKTGKTPKAGFVPRCYSMVQGWRGTCIHTNIGWIPKESCQPGLRITLSWDPLFGKKQGN